MVLVEGLQQVAARLQRTVGRGRHGETERAAVVLEPVQPAGHRGQPGADVDYVAAGGGPVSRDRASEALGVDRSTVAYHLDRLVEEGLLVASFARPAGRGGPGAGRPAKHYARSPREFTASVPPRDYRLAARLLARAAEADTTGTVRRELARAAAEFGRELATGGDELPEDLLDHLARQGFEPFHDGEVVRLRNCPSTASPASTPRWSAA